MDIGKALLVTFLVYALSQGTKAKLSTLWQRYDLGFVLLYGELAVFGVAASDWGHQNIIMGKSLDTLSVPSRLIAGLVIAAFAVGIDNGFKAISNVGIPMPSAVQRVALDAGAANLNTRLQHGGDTTQAPASAPAPAPLPNVTGPPAGLVDPTTAPPAI